MNKQKTSPKSSLERLKSGNHRYVNGLTSIESLPNSLIRSTLAHHGQRPFAAILGCADSRVPSEMVFDCGLGDLFVVRVAGNVVAPSLIASLEFAVSALEVPLIIVMGHSKCGAVQAAIQHHFHASDNLTPHLLDLMGKIQPAVETSLEQNVPEELRLNDVTLKNVQLSCAALMSQSKLLHDRVKSGSIEIMGAVYDLHSGAVSFEESTSKQQEMLNRMELNSSLKRIYAR
jgi:carbonic anhydrase